MAPERSEEHTSELQSLMRISYCNHLSLQSALPIAGRARKIGDARTEPRPGSLQGAPSGRWISYRSVPYREEEISTVHVMDLAMVSAAGGDLRMIARGLPSSEHSVNYFQLDYRWHPSERSEEHTSELQSLMRISYAVFCLKKTQSNTHTQQTETRY